MAEPAYSFTLPSLEDDTALECRLYHPKNINRAFQGYDGRLRGAILAHPYAPLGGCYDANVILAATETLVSQGYVVFTFNFRGAGGSEGKTSWTGRGESEDYCSMIGFLTHYLLSIQQETSFMAPLSPIASRHELEGANLEAYDTSRQKIIDLLLGGYSYGSLILARLAHPDDIMKRFSEAALGTAGAEIILRARTLAKQTASMLLEEVQSPASRGRTLMPDDGATSPTKRAKASPVVMGGEETDPSDRRRSRDSRRSVDIVHRTMEAPKRIKAHIRRHSESTRVQTPPSRESATPTAKSPGYGALSVNVSYLIISTVIMPFTTAILPPGPPSLALTARKSDGMSGAMFLQHPTLAIFGTKDAFTAARRLRAWAEKQAKLSQRQDFEWTQIEGAGHFWQEDGALEALQQRLVKWTSSVP